MGFVSYVYAMIAWALWCTFHSLLITPFVTQRAKERLGERFRFYRLAFNTFSFATFIPVYLYSLSVRGEPVFRWEGSLLIVRYLLLALAVYLFATGARHYSMTQFAGIDQIRTRRTSATLSQNASLDTTGILGAVRHPWYTAVFLILWAQDLSASRILTNVVLTAYMIVGTHLEERKLVHELGDQYREYQRNVSMFFPYRWIMTHLVASA
jgi:methanethiol S-methyltransferase